MKTHADDSVLLVSPVPCHPTLTFNHLQAPHAYKRESSAGFAREHSPYSTASMPSLSSTVNSAYSYSPFDPPRQDSLGPPTSEQQDAPSHRPGGYYNTGAYPPISYCASSYYQTEPHTRKRVYDATNEFFEDAKRYKMAPVYNQEMRSRLQEIGPVFDADDLSSHYTGQQSLQLPSLKSREDFLDAERFLTQLSHTVYQDTSNLPARLYPYSTSPYPALPSTPTSFTAINGSAGHLSGDTLARHLQGYNDTPLYPQIPPAGTVNTGQLHASQTPSLGSRLGVESTRRFSVGVLQKAPSIGVAVALTNGADDGDSADKPAQEDSEITKLLEATHISHEKEAEHAVLTIQKLQTWVRKSLQSFKDMTEAEEGQIGNLYPSVTEIAAC